MMKRINSLILFLILSPLIIAQIETVPADNEVYQFLKEMQVQGILKNYSSVVLPLSRAEVVKDLIQIDNSKNLISNVEQQYLEKLKVKFSLNQNNSYNKPFSLLNDFPNNLVVNLFKDVEKHFYFYRDSTISFYSDLIGDYKYIYSSQFKDNSSLINIGGRGIRKL